MWWKRILRGIIGVALYVGIFIAFDLIPRVDLPTAYFFNRILPHLFATYILYAFVPILSKYIGLVQRRENLPNFDKEVPEGTRDTMMTEVMDDKGRDSFIHSLKEGGVA